MKFQIDKASLAYLLGIASTIVERRNTMPILANTKIDVGKKSVTISATDLEISMIADVEADVEEVGSITVGARMIHDIVRDLPGESVKISALKGSRLQIKSGSSDFKINGTSSEEFPSLVGCDLKSPVKVEAKKIFEMLDKTSYAVSTDETRHNINGVSIETFSGEAGKINGSGPDNGIRFVATDGHRLALVDREAEGIKLSKNVIVPRKGISEIKRVLEANEGDVKLGFNEGFLSIESENQLSGKKSPKIRVRIGVRLLDGQFPNYKEVLPKDIKTNLTANRSELLSTIKRVALVTTDRSKAIKLEVTDSEMILSSSSPEHGEARETLPISKEGEDASIGFSARYLVDLLGTMSGDEDVQIQLSGNLGPGIFQSSTDEHYRSVVMPMRFD